VTNVKAIADKYGLQTADQAPPPKPKEPPAALKLSPRGKDVFNFIGPAALSIVATDGPVSVTLYDRHGHVRRRYGHNRGVWPARVVKGAAWRDTATIAWDKNPMMPMQTQIRLWTRREAGRDRLADSIVDLIAQRSEADGCIGELDHGFRDLGPELDLEFFEMELHGIGERLGLPVWDDDGLVRYCESVGRAFDAIKAERPDFKWGERIVVEIADRIVAQMKGVR
jgi:hypothetical protein